MSGSAPSTAGGLPAPLAMLMANAGGGLRGATVAQVAGRVPRGLNLSQPAGASSRTVVTGSVGGVSSSSSATAVRDGPLHRAMNPVQLSEEASRVVLRTTLQVMRGTAAGALPAQNACRTGHTWVQLTTIAVC